VTQGGLIGKIKKVSDDEVSVDLGDTEVRVVKATIASVKAKTEPAKD
jgi:preprotein translocase subunit YajC